MTTSPAGPIGLTSEEARRRLAIHGPNEIRDRERRGLGRILAGIATEPMFGLLLLAAVVYLALGDLAEGMLRAAFAALTVGLVVLQERRSERALDALRESGVGLAFDHASDGPLRLDVISRIRPACMRVDQEVIARLPDARDTRALLRAIVGLSHAMSMRVLADGVRTPDQLACLRDLGVDEAQGPHLGPPMPAEAVPAWLRAFPGLAGDRSAL